jgi:hypothetical protein
MQNIEDQTASITEKILTKFNVMEKGSETLPHYNALDSPPHHSLKLLLHLLSAVWTASPSMTTKKHSPNTRN